MSEVIIPEKLQKFIEEFSEDQVLGDLSFFLDSLIIRKVDKKPTKDGFKDALEDVVEDLKWRLDYIENIQKMFDEFLADYKDSPENLTELLKLTKKKLTIYYNETE